MTIRDTITLAIRESLPPRVWADADEIADEVVRALGLRQEWGSLDENHDGVLADDREELRPWASETIKTRWITDWVPCD